MHISPVLWQFLIKWLHASALFPAEASTIAPAVDALYFFLSRIFTYGPSVVGWYNWYAIEIGADGRRESLVAGAGYMGPPMEELVEIGYSVVPEARGRGFATEIVQGLVTHALAVDSVQTVIAHTLASNATSQGVLKRAGFLAAGPGSEPGVLRFERSRG